MLLLNQFFRILNKHKAPILNILEILAQAAVFKTMQMEFILLPDVDSGGHPNFILLSALLPALRSFEA